MSQSKERTTQLDTFDCTNPYHLVTDDDIEEVCGEKPERTASAHAPLEAGSREAKWTLPSGSCLQAQVDVDDLWAVTETLAKAAESFTELPGIALEAFRVDDADGSLLKARVASKVAVSLKTEDSIGADTLPLLIRAVERFGSVYRSGVLKPEDLMLRSDVEAVFGTSFIPARQREEVEDVSWRQFYYADKARLRVEVMTGTPHMWWSARMLAKAAGHTLSLVSDIGDEAYFNQSRGQLNVRVGDTMLRVGVQGDLPVDQATYLPQELANLAIARLAGYKLKVERSEDDGN